MAPAPRMSPAHPRSPPMTDQITPAEPPQWQREFPHFPADAMPAIPGSWSDTSWHNDAMPSFLLTSTLGLWVDYPDPAHSDFPEWRASGQMKRFTLARLKDGEHTEEPIIAHSDD